MTSTVIPGVGIAQVSLLFSQGDGEMAENVFYVDTGGGVAIDSSGLQEINTDFRDWWEVGAGSGQSYQALMQSSCALVEVRSRDMTTPTSGEEVLSVGINGTDGGGKLPQGLTFTLTCRSGLTGKSFRGRSYLVGLTDNFVNGGQFDVADTTHANHAAAAFNALITKVATTGSNQLVIASRFETLPGPPAVPNTLRAAILATPVTSYGYHDLFMDYQRRRAPSHNRHH